MLLRFAWETESLLTAEWYSLSLFHYKLKKHRLPENQSQSKRPLNLCHRMLSFYKIRKICFSHQLSSTTDLLLELLSSLVWELLLVESKKKLKEQLKKKKTPHLRKSLTDLESFYQRLLLSFASLFGQ